jgi:hypothetical protein
MKAFYSIRVRRKNGVWQTERQSRRAELPKEGENVSITLGSEEVKAHVLYVTEPLPANERGELVHEVYAAEI